MQQLRHRLQPAQNLVDRQRRNEGRIRGTLEPRCENRQKLRRRPESRNRPDIVGGRKARPLPRAGHRPTDGKGKGGEKPPSYTWPLQIPVQVETIRLYTSET